MVLRMSFLPLSEGERATTRIAPTLRSPFVPRIGVRGRPGHCPQQVGKPVEVGKWGLGIQIYTVGCVSERWGQ